MKVLCWIILGVIFLGANVFAIYRIITDTPYFHHKGSYYFLCAEAFIGCMLLLNWIMNVLTGGS